MILKKYDDIGQKNQIITRISMHNHSFQKNLRINSINITIIFLKIQELVKWHCIDIFAGLSHEIRQFFEAFWRDQNWMFFDFQIFLKPEPGKVK